MATTLSAILYLCSTVIYAATDDYGITQIYKTKSGGVNYYPGWDAKDRTIESVDTDDYSPDKACVGRGSKSTFEIDASSGIMTMTGSTPRYYCYLEHTNVEVTAYAKRGFETAYKSYQGMVIVARSRHKDYKDDACQARGYYFRLYNSGQACFLKEFIHSTSGCLVYSTGNPCVDFDTITKGKWYGMKLVIQNNGNSVNLRGYVDLDNGKNGGDWEKILEYTDNGDWEAYVESDEKDCMKDCGYDGDEAWTSQGNSVFVRASYVKDYQWKWFSIREIQPFQLNSGESSPVSSPVKAPTKAPTKSSSSGSSTTINLELHKNAGKWWMAVKASSSGSDIKSLRMKGNGAKSWEIGEDAGYAFIFNTAKPYSAPFDFKVELEDGSTGTKYDAIKTLSGGQSATMTAAEAFTVEEDTNDTDWNVMGPVIAILLIVLIACMVIGGYWFRKRQKSRGEVTFDKNLGITETPVETEGNNDDTKNNTTKGNTQVEIEEIEVELELDE